MIVIILLIIVYVCVVIFCFSYRRPITGGSNLNTQQPVKRSAMEMYTFTIDLPPSYEEYKKAVYERIHNLEYPVKRLQYSNEKIKEMFKNLCEYKPRFANRAFSVSNITPSDPNFKSRYFLTFTGKIPGEHNLDYSQQIIIPSNPDNYEKIDIIADMFNELPRIKSPGYGSQYSSYDHWQHIELCDVWLRPLYDKKVTSFNSHIFREGLYAVITEPRQEKPASYVSVFNMLPPGDRRVFDTSSAYGDRLLTALATNSTYYGVDPWTDLFSGYDKIFEMFGNHTNCKMLNAPSEEVIVFDKKFNLALMSPAPFDVEPYASYSEEAQVGQSYITYPEYDDWLVCYILATIAKVYNYLEDDGLFMIKILDRTAKSGGKIITYVEVTLLYAEAIGFEYIGAIGYQGGGGSVVPWWTLRKSKNDSRRLSAIQLLEKYYNKIFKRIRSQLFLQPIVKSVEINDGMYKGSVDSYVYETPCLYREIARKELMTLVKHSCCQVFHSAGVTIPDKEIFDIIGRYLMVQSIDRKMMHDPVFPTGGNSFDQLIENVKYTNPTIELEDILLNGTYHLVDKTYTGIVALMEGAIVQLNIEFNKKHGKCPKSVKRYLPASIKNFLRPKYNYKEEEFEVLVDIMITRYETLGADIHQQTRDEARHIELTRICGADFETFAAPLNAYSSKYFSVFPDVDKYFGSLGSFFMSKLEAGIYLANPVNDPIFVINSHKYIMEQMRNATAKLTFLFGLVTYNSEPYDKYDFNKKTTDIKEWYIQHGNMAYIKNVLKDSKFAFIINNEKFKTIDPITRQTKISKIVSIVCVITNDDIITMEKFKSLSTLA